MAAFLFFIRYFIFGNKYARTNRRFRKHRIMMVIEKPNSVEFRTLSNPRLAR